MSDANPSLAALGRVPSGLFIVTARHGEHETGLLASLAPAVFLHAAAD